MHRAMEEREKPWIYHTQNGGRKRWRARGLGSEWLIPQHSSQYEEFQSWLIKRIQHHQQDKIATEFPLFFGATLPPNLCSRQSTFGQSGPVLNESLGSQVWSEPPCMTSVPIWVFPCTCTFRHRHAQIFHLFHLALYLSSFFSMFSSLIILLQTWQQSKTPGENESKLINGTWHSLVHVWRTNLPRANVRQVVR
jgi:hypothetical protein